MAGQGDYPLRSIWFRARRGQNYRALPRKIITTSVSDSPNAAVWSDWFFQAGSGAQNLTATLFTNSQTFHAPTVSTTYALTAPLYTNGQTFYAATVTQGFTLSASLFTNSQTFYGPTVTATRDLAPSLFTNSQTFYAPAVTTSYTLLPSLFTDADTIYAPTVTTTYALAPSLYTNTTTLYAPSVSATYALLPSLVTDGDQFYAPTVAATYSLPAPLIPSGNTFFSPTVGGGTPVQPVTSGSLIRPRRKFRPSILLPFEPTEIHATVRLPTVEAESSINPPIARPEINASPRIAPDYTVAETYINSIRASSSWNDPTDLEMSLIAELLFD